MKNLFFTVLFTGSVALGLGACGAAEEVEEVVDCAQICEAYGDCVQELTDTEYDELACINNCEAKSDEDTEFRAQANTCEQCIDDTEDTCTATAFACADECASVVIEVEI